MSTEIIRSKEGNFSFSVLKLKFGKFAKFFIVSTFFLNFYVLRWSTVVGTAGVAKNINNGICTKN